MSNTGGADVPRRRKKLAALEDKVTHGLTAPLTSFQTPVIAGDFCSVAVALVHDTTIAVGGVLERAMMSRPTSVAWLRGARRNKASSSSTPNRRRDLVFIIVIRV